MASRTRMYNSYPLGYVQIRFSGPFASKHARAERRAATRSATAVAVHRTGVSNTEYPDNRIWTYPNG
eukprot:4152846-Pleurochrysis_carterae.AAC.1